MAKSILSRFRSCLKRAFCCGLSLLHLPAVLFFACLGGVFGLVIGIASGGSPAVLIVCALLGAVLGASLTHCCCKSLRSCDVKDDGSDSSDDDEVQVEVGFDMGKCLCGEEEEDEQSCWDPSDPCTCNWQSLLRNLIRRLLNITCSFVFNLCCCCNKDDDGSSTTSSSSTNSKDSTHEDDPNPTVLNQPEVQLCERPENTDNSVIKIPNPLLVKQPEDSKDGNIEDNNDMTSSSWLYEVFLGSLFRLWNDITNLEYFTNRSSSDEESDLEAGNEGPEK